MISTAAENTSALWTVSGNPFQRVGAVLRNDLAPECFLFVLSSNPEMLSLHWVKTEWTDGPAKEPPHAVSLKSRKILKGYGIEGP